MIDETNTQKIFGYTSNELSQFSSKKVVVICSQCKNSRTIAKHLAVRSKSCINCQRINQAKIIAKTNRLGRKHSEETKEKIRNSHLSLDLTGTNSPNYGIKRTKEHKKAISEANKKRIVSDETKIKMSLAKKGKTLPETQRKKMGESRKGKRNPNYGKKAAHGKGYYYNSKDGSKIWMRSTWEIKTATYLDLNEISWQYEYMAYPIKYSNKEGTYRPDFAILKNGKIEEFWEIKGYWRDDAKEKYEAFVAQYPQYKILLMQKNELKSKGIL